MNILNLSLFANQSLLCSSSSRWQLVGHQHSFVWSLARRWASSTALTAEGSCDHCASSLKCCMLAFTLHLRTKIYPTVSILWSLEHETLIIQKHCSQVICICLWLKISSRDFTVIFFAFRDILWPISRYLWWKCFWCRRWAFYLTSISLKFNRITW